VIGVGPSASNMQAFLNDKGFPGQIIRL